MNKNKNDITIVDYTPELSVYIKLLNYEWLQKYFKVEPGDELSLSDPQKYILDKGGFIFYAKLNSEIIGTVSLLKKSEGTFEIGKMAVTETAQGLGIGTLLLEYCLAISKQKGIKHLILYSNTILQTAIRMYRKYGFKEIELESGLYERANIKMERWI